MDIGFSTGTNTNVSVGLTTTVVLAHNTGRKYALLVNDSDQAIYLGLGTAAVMNKGIRLSANGGALEIDGPAPFRGAVNAICLSGTKNLTIFEA